MIPIRDTVPRRSPPIATWLLILANSVVFLFELMTPQPLLEQVFHVFGIVPAQLYTFLHGGWLHVIGNMWTLWIFGDNVEDRMGPVRFVIFYLLCGLVAGLVHCLTNPDSTLPDSTFSAEVERSPCLYCLTCGRNGAGHAG